MVDPIDADLDEQQAIALGQTRLTRATLAEGWGSLTFESPRTLTESGKRSTLA